ncbi:integrase catalytic region [Trifolium medium]|uniref:Integrase catalytic region n=1 Tax=Trifolium medium TaxID=97028 RepID=A0A392MFI8_9FABA|nr:integrase catalytic region [Trifolium medium]
MDHQFSFRFHCANTLVFHENAIDAWEEDLHEHFAISINNLNQGTKSFLDYFTEMRTLWEKLNSHRPMPNFTCIQILLIDPLPSINKVYSLVIQEAVADPLPGHLPRLW